MLSNSAIKKVVADHFAAIRAMDKGAWIGTFAEDAVSYDPVGTPPSVGHRGLQQFYEMIVGVFEKFGITEDTVIICGANAAVKWTGQGVGKNGVEVTFEGIDAFEINESGKIQKVWSYWNPEPLMAQLLS